MKIELKQEYMVRHVRKVEVEVPEDMEEDMDDVITDWVMQQEEELDWEHESYEDHFQGVIYSEPHWYETFPSMLERAFRSNNRPDATDTGIYETIEDMKKQGITLPSEGTFEAVAPHLSNVPKDVIEKAIVAARLKGLF
ncbi:MAG TPA: hypothetical protein PKZ35_09860 [Gammaproteobacteria bacterium]|nr:hypothetical protein [Gammaproteobacteria bacterium]